MDKFFEPQNLIFDITLCGDFAGQANTFAQTCSGTCYKDYVIGPPNNYDNAYFEINYVRVYGSNTIVKNAATSSFGNRWWGALAAMLFGLVVM
jgi:hypothetical protein